MTSTTSRALAALIILLLVATPAAQAQIGGYSSVVSVTDESCASGLRPRMGGASSKVPARTAPASPSPWPRSRRPSASEPVGKLHPVHASAP